MPRQTGDIIKDRIAFTFSPINLRDVQASMNEKEFTSLAALMNTALRFYFEHRDKTSDIDQVKEWLVSDDGAHYIKDLIRKELRSK